MLDSLREEELFTPQSSNHPSVSATRPTGTILRVSSRRHSASAMRTSTAGYSFECCTTFRATTRGRVENPLCRCISNLLVVSPLL